MGIFCRLAELERTGTSAALATVVMSRGSAPRHPGAKMIVSPDSRIEGTVGGGEMESRVVRIALRVLESGEPQLLHFAYVNPTRGDPGSCGGEIEVFVEGVLPLQDGMKADLSKG